MPAPGCKKIFFLTSGEAENDWANHTIGISLFPWRSPNWHCYRHSPFCIRGGALGDDPGHLSSFKYARSLRKNCIMSISKSLDFVQEIGTIMYAGGILSHIVIGVVLGHPDAETAYHVLCI